MRNNNPGFLKNQKGVAVVEMLPLLAVFILLFGLTFGFWTSIHSGTLSSIAARHYAFEVINNRENFLYSRDTQKPTEPNKSYYEKNGYRFFAVVESQPNNTPRLISPIKELSLFNQGEMKITVERGGVSPIKIKAGYGICNDASTSSKCSSSSP